jgi:hypothetical protein
MDQNNIGSTLKPQSQPNETYFAAGPAETLASTCLEKAKSFYNTMTANLYLEKLRKNWMFYHGEYGDGFAGGSHQVGFSGEQGELTTLPVNHYRNIAQHMLVMITSNRPTMEARAVNTDYKSLAQTFLANGILDYYMREKRLEDAIRRVTEMAIVLGAGFVRMEWNATSGELYDFDPETGEKNWEGEIEVTTHSPFDVVFDGTKEDWDNEWIIIRSFKNKFNLMAKYPELADRISGVPTKTDNSIYRTAIFTNDDTTDIPVFEFYHKRTEALPEGRYCLFLDSDIVLLDIPLPYRQIPVFRISAGEFMGTPYGYSPMFDVFPIQEGINSLYSTIMTNQSQFGVQNLYVQRGSDIQIDSLQGSMNIIEGNSKPESLNLTQTPKEIFDFLNMLIQAAETISGVNSVARGDPQSSLKSGTALALVQSMALQFISGLQNNYVRLIEDVGGSLINILKDFAKTPKTVALVGKNNRPLLKEFVGDDIDAISRVIVDVGNPLSKTTAGRVQMAEQLLQMGLIKNPKQYFQVMNTGSLDATFESEMNEILLIKRENEYLLEGKEVIADMLDTHAEHILEHRTVLADPDLRMNPELRAVVQKHMQEHIDFLRTVDPDLLVLTGQKPLTNPNTPQNPPPPPGPPGAPPPGGDPSQVMTPPSGMPQDPQTLMTGQGSTGGNMVPGVPSPPPPFQNLPTSPKGSAPN